jgi:hypothetical protein
MAIILTLNKESVFMDIMYWILAMWVIVGFIVAVAFGYFSDRGQGNDSSVSTVKHLGNFHRHPVPSAVNARRVRSIPRDIQKSA